MAKNNKMHGVLGAVFYLMLVKIVTVSANKNNKYINKEKEFKNEGVNYDH